MDVTEALDRELIVERAEAVRLWLLGLPLSNRATSAIQRELSAIIDNDPGAYINGQRPLAGMTVAEFIAELSQPNAGAVGRVKSISYAALNELRAKIPAGAGAPPEAPEEPDYTIPELDTAEAAAPEASKSVPEPFVATPVPNTGSSLTEPQPQRRRRPKGPARAASTAAAKRATDTVPSASPAPPTVAALESPAPAESPAAPAAREGDDPMLSQIVRLWPTLHPHARRAVVMYASELWAEAGYEVGS